MTPEKARLGARIWHLWPIVALLAGGWLLGQRFEGIEAQHILDALATVPPIGWIGAIGATWLSLMAVGQYDAILHRALGTGIEPRLGRRAGLIAISISQTTGFGTLVASLVRWRCLPDWSLWRAGRFSIRVSLSFFALWAVVTAAALAIWPAAPPLARGASLALLGVTAVILALPAGRRLLFSLIPREALPPLLAATFVDTVFACLALNWLLPEAAEPGLAVYPIYLLALGAALATGAPGGVGVFDLTLLAFLPQTDEAGILASVLAFRLIYYLIPAFLGLAALFRPARPLGTAIPPFEAPAEWGLIHQGARILRAGASYWLFRDLSGLVVTIGPALGRADLPALSEKARQAKARLVLYKAGPAEAAGARRLGWSIVRIAQEAVIPLPGWTSDGPAYRQLRRHLRHAEQAGVAAAQVSWPLPLADLERINRAWIRRNGRERGFSMGRFDALLLGRQRVFVAISRGRIIAFASFHEGRHDWCLDLMRQEPGCPDGTMHLLVARAIAAARQEGARSLSLAAAPNTTGPMSDWLPRSAQAPGLRRFKQCFAPDWQPRYLCAPNPYLLTRATLTIAAAIHLPRQDRSKQAPGGSVPEFRFELPPASCDCDAWNHPNAQAPALPQTTGPSHDRRTLPPS